MAFTIPSHLTTFNTPLAAFSASRPEFTDFVVGGLIFSASNEDTGPSTRVLLLQRSLSDSYGGYWEAPAGGVDATIDGTILEATAREVREETGLHVSRFVDLVAVDEWTREKPDMVHKAAKFTFLVEVQEAGSGGWEEGVKLEETEHQAFAWATEEEVREGVAEKGPYRFVGAGGRNLLKAFEMFNNSGTQIITECK